MTTETMVWNTCEGIPEQIKSNQVAIEEGKKGKAAYAQIRYMMSPSPKQLFVLRSSQKDPRQSSVELMQFLLEYTEPSAEKRKSAVMDTRNRALSQASEHVVLQQVAEDLRSMLARQVSVTNQIKAEYEGTLGQLRDELARTKSENERLKRDLTSALSQLDSSHNLITSLFEALSPNHPLRSAPIPQMIELESQKPYQEETKAPLADQDASLVISEGTDQSVDEEKQEEPTEENRTKEDEDDANESGLLDEDQKPTEDSKDEEGAEGARSPEVRSKWMPTMFSGTGRSFFSNARERQKKRQSIIGQKAVNASPTPLGAVRLTASATHLPTPTSNFTSNPSLPRGTISVSPSPTNDDQTKARTQTKMAVRYISELLSVGRTEKKATESLLFDISSIDSENVTKCFVSLGPNYLEFWSQDQSSSASVSRSVVKFPIESLSFKALPSNPPSIMIHYPDIEEISSSSSSSSAQSPTDPIVQWFDQIESSHCVVLLNSSSEHHQKWMFELKKAKFKFYRSLSKKSIPSPSSSFSSSSGTFSPLSESSSSSFFESPSPSDPDFPSSSSSSSSSSPAPVPSTPSGASENLTKRARQILVMSEIISTEQDFHTDLCQVLSVRKKFENEIDPAIINKIFFNINAVSNLSLRLCDELEYALTSSSQHAFCLVFKDYVRAFFFFFFFI